MRKLVFLLSLLISSFAFAQTTSLPIDFEDGIGSITFTDFDGGVTSIIENPDSSAVDTSDFVAEHIRDGGQVWAGTYITLDGALDFSTNNTFKIKVWSPAVDVPVLFKLENADASQATELTVNTTVANEWEELSFNFDGASSGVFTKIILIFNNGVLGDGTANSTYYFDDIQFVEGQAANIPTVAAPTPTQDEADVISLFSDAYTDEPVDSWRTDWSVATLEDVTIEGNDAKKYSSLDFVGIETTTNQLDVSGMTHLHIDLWSADITSFGIKLVDFGADGAYGGGDDTEHQLNFSNPAQQEWISYDIPLSNFTNLTSQSNIAQYILVGQPTGATTIFIDNFYFYNQTSTETYTVTFNVTDGTNALEGVTVGINGETLTTGANGEAVIDLANGTYPYTANLDGYEEATGDVIVDGAAQTVNVTLSETVINVPTVGAPTPPDRNPGDVISIFSDAYTDVTGTNFNPAWGQSTVVTTEEIDGNPTFKYASFNYQGIQFGSAQNVSELDTLHLDMWTDNATTVNIYCISSGPVEKAYSLPITQGEWVSYDIPLTEFSDVVDLTDLIQFKFDGGDGSQTIYLDNLYFYRSPGVTTYAVNFNVTDGSNPIEGANIAVNSQNLVTDAGGAATVYLEDGDYSYTVSASGYEEASGDITVAGADQTVDVTLTANPSPTVAAPTPPAREPENVISVFSNAYTNIQGIDYNPYWGQSTNVTMEEIEGNQTLVYNNFNYQGIDLGGNYDMSEMEYVHIDMWTWDATNVQFSPISVGGEYLVELSPITAGAWESYDIPLTTFTDNGVTLSDIYQLKFDGQAGAVPTVIYLDNIYFYKEATGVNHIANTTVQVYPNPVKDQLNIITKEFGSNAFVRITDLSGRVIYNAPVNSNQTTVNMTSYANGTYILTVNNENGSAVSKHLIIKR
ncbi:carboxypeptidase regulatory-like domain-containing protein [Salinivirga cyanobacteriivorans]|uniref:carboxypeptidase regulatory-like domain-containing protein n=1 Tax=Salinivirga cyanobacteriivorans TaxID=1307839 RepID=UPI000716DA84|nr:carboxypeptidase regulatory-like domain-containing protein [Salinivirga cyanobacteriivorans]